jgi:hypothetical protein
MFKQSTRNFKPTAANEQVRHHSPPLLFIFFLLIFAQAGCRTVATLPPVNLKEPGWTVQQGQAVWRTKQDAPEIAGELIVAENPDGRSFVQFTKTPLPFVVALTTSNSWQIQFVPENKTFSGRGKPPTRLAWLYLPRCLEGQPPPRSWKWQRTENDGWRLENWVTGQSLEGFLNP